LWTLFLFKHHADKDQQGWGTYAIAGTMMALSIISCWAVCQRKLAYLFISFAVSFIPVGLYLLLVPSLFRLIGLAGLFYLFAAIFLYRQPTAHHNKKEDEKF